MVKTWLKHKIYELSVNVFFNRIIDSFQNPEVDHSHSLLTPMDAIEVIPISKPVGIIYALRVCYD